MALELAAAAIGRGDRVGVRISSRTTTLYVAGVGRACAGVEVVSRVQGDVARCREVATGGVSSRTVRAGCREQS